MTKVVYLTIDDAPSETFMDKFNFLDEHNIPAIWFAMGSFMEKRPEMMIEAIQRGAIIGNHSYSHPNFSSLTVEQCFAEIRATDAILNDLHTEANVPRKYHFFRFPYGDKGDLREGDNESAQIDDGTTRHAEIQAYLRSLGYVQPEFADVNYDWFKAYLQDVDWYWTYDSHDWSPMSDNPVHGIDSAEKVLARLDEDVPDGWRGLNDNRSADIILVHDFPGELHDLFKQIILRLKEKDISLQSVI